MIFFPGKQESVVTYFEQMQNWGAKQPSQKSSTNLQMEEIIKLITTESQILFQTPFPSFLYLPL